MPTQVLWLDNDIAYIKPYKDTLIEAGFDVTVVRAVGEADFRARNNSYDLVILDVMVPTKGSEEEKLYPPEETDFGHKTGFVFYRRVKELLDAAQSKVIVMTVRLDESVKDEFIKVGLPHEHFATKFALRDAAVFLNKVKSVMTERDK